MASRIGPAVIVQLTTRPSFSRSISPASSSVRRCFMTPGSDMSNGCASSVTGRAPLASAASMPLRVRSASAEKMASSGSPEDDC
jgi:hypothetical protein